MNITSNQILQYGTATFLVGLIIGVIYDVLDFICKKITKSNSKLLFIHFFKDIVFALCYTTSAILVLYYCCNGRLRGIYIFILILGFLTNKVLISRSVGKVLELLYKLFVKFIKILYSIFIQPIEKIIKRMYNKIKNSKYFNRSKLHDERKKHKKTE